MWIQDEAKNEGNDNQEKKTKHFCLFLQQGINEIVEV